MHLGLLCYNGQEEATLSEILTHLEKVYCGQLSAEIHHIEVRHQISSSRSLLAPDSSAQNIYLNLLSA